MIPVTLLVTAWPKTEDRRRCLERTLRGLQRVRADGCEVRRLVSCESAAVGGEHRRWTADLCDALGFAHRFRDAAPSLGLHLDELYRSHVPAESLVLYVQDDWVLEQDLQLGPGCRLLAAGDAAIIRYHWEPRKLRGQRPATLIRSGESFAVLPEHYPDHFSHHPHLVHRALYDQFGPFGGRRSQEREMNRRVREANIRVVGRMPPVFRHVGRHSTIRPGKVWDVREADGV